MSFRRRLDSGDLLIGTWVTIPAPGIVEGVSAAGLDFVVFDLEHGETGIESRLGELVRAADAAGVDALVRVPEWQLDYLGRLLDIGVQGFIIPQVDDASIIERARDAAYHPPIGRRGFSPQTRAGGYGAVGGSLRSGAQGDPVLIAQIESIKGMENLTEIAKSAGLDCVILGPNDLSHSIDLSQQEIDYDIEKAIRMIGNEATRNGLVFGGVCSDAEGAEPYRRLGARMLILSGGLLWHRYDHVVKSITRPDNSE
jgi:2-keto-3-deoxy-L-rhamnonate aldolase RhmA